MRHVRVIPLGPTVTQHTSIVHAAPARSMAHMWRCGMHQACADIMQCMVLDCKRPDAAAAVVMELTDRQCATATAADLLAQLVRTDRTPAAVEVLRSLLATHHYLAAARACIEMARCAEIGTCVAQAACFAHILRLALTAAHIVGTFCTNLYVCGPHINFP